MRSQRSQHPTRVTSTDRRMRMTRKSAARTLLGLARSGVYLAPLVTKQAVRSYRTFSPLPVMERSENQSIHRRFILCGTFPRSKLHSKELVQTGGHYPPPNPAVLGLSSRHRFPVDERSPCCIDQLYAFHCELIAQGSALMQKISISDILIPCPKPDVYSGLILFRRQSCAK